MLSDTVLLHQVATLYYTNGLKQEEIAKELSISRPMVSRALKKAEEMGIVKITVAPLEGFSPEERKLQALLGIDRVIIASSDGDAPLLDIAATASQYLNRLFSDGMVVGLGWGRTLYETVSVMCNGARTHRDLTFVPLVGSAGRNEFQFQVNNLVSSLARKYDSMPLFFNFPAFVKSAVMSYCIQNPEYILLRSLWKKLDIALIGLGSFGPEPSFPMDEFMAARMDYLKEMGAVGDILGRFFNKEGMIKPLDFGEDYIGISSENLASVKNVICLCGGKTKVDPIITASRNHFINTLITDSITAKDIEKRIGK